MIVGHVDADELAKHDEQHDALQQRPNERPEEPEDRVLIPKLQFAECEEVEQFVGSANLAVDRSSPPS
jgi:hypothetical protein